MLGVEYHLSFREGSYAGSWSLVIVIRLDGSFKRWVVLGGNQLRVGIYLQKGLMSEISLSWTRYLESGLSQIKVIHMFGHLLLHVPLVSDTRCHM